MLSSCQFERQIDQRVEPCRLDCSEFSAPGEQLPGVVWLGEPQCGERVFGGVTMQTWWTPRVSLSICAAPDSCDSCPSTSRAALDLKPPPPACEIAEPDSFQEALLW